MFDVAWELFKSPLVWVMLISVVGGTAYVGYIEYKERNQ